MNAISTNYRRLNFREVESVAADCARAWQNPEIPERQYRLCVKDELEDFRAGYHVLPFVELLRLLYWIPLSSKQHSLLDIGAASGYYSEVVAKALIDFQYRACDYSTAFKALASKLYPGIQYDIENALSLSYPDNAFDVVLNGGCMMHVYEYEKALQESARVAKEFCIFHRVPVSTGPTEFWLKEAYSVPVIEVHFNEAELLALFDKNRLEVVKTAALGDSGQNSYLCRKVSESEREWERA